MCYLLWTDNVDSIVNQVLNDVPKSVAIIRQVPRGSMVVAVRARIIPLWKWVWWRTNLREPQIGCDLRENNAQWCNQRSVVALGAATSSFLRLRSLSSRCDVVHKLDGRSIKRGLERGGRKWRLHKKGRQCRSGDLNCSDVNEILNPVPQGEAPIG